MKNHYQTLGLEEGASQEAIQEAYDRLFKELDPVNNDNQEFFIEELEKLEEAYKVLRNSSILATEGGINNSNVKPTSSSKSIKNKNEFNKESKKINLLQWLIKEKKKIILFILVTLFVKIVIHFFIFPTETLVLNIDKKVFNREVYLDFGDWVMKNHFQYLKNNMLTDRKIERMRKEGYFLTGNEDEKKLYSDWVDFVGGEKNVFLRDYLKNAKLA